MGQEACLRAIAVLPCGWSDLASPQRVEEVLRRSRTESPTDAPSTGYLNQAEQVSNSRAAFTMRHLIAGNATAVLIMLAGAHGVLVVTKSMLEGISFPPQAGRQVAR